jgi:hypothetical protein
MMNETGFVQLAGSERRPLPAARLAEPADPAERIELTNTDQGFIDAVTTAVHACSGLGVPHGATLLARLSTNAAIPQKVVTPIVPQQAPGPAAS